MKAWVIDGMGGSEVYRVAELSVPEPGSGEVQVRVDAAGMNPVDWKIREGKYPSGGLAFPAVTLREFSGIVSKLGDGVSGFNLGDGVYGITNVGAAAEFTVANTSAIGPRPTSIGPAEAATVPLAGMTAWQAIFDHGRLEPGQRVLIHAAAGGVGTFAVQLAKWKGAYVIGTATSPNHPLLRQLGADELIDYTTEKFDEVVQNVDLVLHSIGPEALAGSLKVLKPGGRLVAISAQPDVEEARKQGKEALVFSMQPSSEDLRHLAELIDLGKVRPVVAKIVSLEDAREAMDELQRGHLVGKIAVRIQ